MTQVESAYLYRVGIDWASQHHQVCIVDRAGEIAVASGVPHVAAPLRIAAPAESSPAGMINIRRVGLVPRPSRSRALPDGVRPATRNSACGGPHSRRGQKKARSGPPQNIIQYWAVYHLKICFRNIRGTTNRQA